MVHRTVLLCRCATTFLMAYFRFDIHYGTFFAHHTSQTISDVSLSYKSYMLVYCKEKLICLYFGTHVIFLHFDPLMMQIITMQITLQMMEEFSYFCILPFCYISNKWRMQKIEKCVYIIIVFIKLHELPRELVFSVYKKLKCQLIYHINLSY